MASYVGKGAPSNGSIYICNLPYGTDENMLAEYFGTIGVLKVGKFACLFLCVFAFCFISISLCEDFLFLFFFFLPIYNSYCSFFSRLFNLQRKTSEQVDQRSGCIVINQRMNLKGMLL